MTKCMIIIILVRAVHDPKGLFIIYTLGLGGRFLYCIQKSHGTPFLMLLIMKIPLNM